MSENKFQGTPLKLCPFRKKISAYYYQSEIHPRAITSMSNAEWVEEEFMPCLRGACSAFFKTKIGPCPVEGCDFKSIKDI